MSRVASRSARRRALTKMSVERCSLDQLEQPGVHRRPDASGAPGRPAAGPLDGLVDDLAERAHVLDRDDDLDLERLAHPGVDDGDRPGPALAVGALVAAEEPGDLVERALGGRQPDALRRAARTRASSRSSVSARWAPRLVAASAWISSMITASTPRSVSRAADVSIR